MVMQTEIVMPAQRHGINKTCRVRNSRVAKHESRQRHDNITISTINIAREILQFPSSPHLLANIYYECVRVARVVAVEFLHDHRHKYTVDEYQKWSSSSFQIVIVHKYAVDAVQANSVLVRSEACTQSGTTSFDAACPGTRAYQASFKSSLSYIALPSLPISYH